MKTYDKDECMMHEMVKKHGKYCPIVLTSVLLIVLAVRKYCKYRKEDKLRKHIMQAVKNYENKYGAITKKQREYIVDELKKALKEDLKQKKDEQKAAKKGNKK